MLSIEEVVERTKILRNGHFYDKIMREATARPGIIGETIETIIDNEVETINTITEPSMVLNGVKGEQLVLKNDNFYSKYEHIEGNRYKTKPNRVLAIQVTEEIGNFSFIAPWKQKMICNIGDYIVCTSFKDVYRVEKDIFNLTYILSQN